MNRRSFIGTITALAGIVLAKIKAPAADPLHTVTHPYWRSNDHLSAADRLMVHYQGRFDYGDIQSIVFNDDNQPIGVVLFPEAQKKLDNP